MFVLFAIYLAKKMKLIKDSKTNFQQMERAQNVVSGGFSGMMNSVRDSMPSLGGSQLSSLEMIFRASAEAGRLTKEQLQKSEWAVKEKGVMATLNRIGSLKRKANFSSFRNTEPERHYIPKTANTYTEDPVSNASGV